MRTIAPAGRGAARVVLAASMFLFTACSPDSIPTEAQPGLPPDLGLAAFRLTIDVSTGAIAVDGPSGTGSAGAGASFSLLGSDVVALHAGNCTWTTTPGNSKQRRCTFDLAVENLLTAADLVTPTTFPHPPAGTTGILVFPFAAAALGVNGGGAVPSPDWDNAPANFFNDFSGCSGKNSDCYRSETYPGPLYGGAVTEARAVGFDVDRNAHSVSVYVVVAADLRENIPRQVALDGHACGWVSNRGSAESMERIDVSETDPPMPSSHRGVCGFLFVAELFGKRIDSATLQFFQAEVAGTLAYGVLGNVVVDHIEYEDRLTPDDWFADPLEADIGPLSTDATLGYKSLEVASQVRADLDAGRDGSRYRLRFEGGTPPRDSGSGFAYFDNTHDPNPPRLVVVYRNP
jgi:hypothetical protein